MHMKSHQQHQVIIGGKEVPLVGVPRPPNKPATTKCVQRKIRCTFVKFHRQTAPVGPGHNPRPPATSLTTSASAFVPSSSAPSASSLRLYPHVEESLLESSVPPPTSASMPTMADTLYASQTFAFPQLYPQQQQTHHQPDPGGIVNSDPDFMAKYRARAELLAQSGGLPMMRGMYASDRRPGSSSSASPPATVSSSSTWMNAWPHSNQMSADPYRQHIQERELQQGDYPHHVMASAARGQNSNMQMPVQDGNYQAAIHGLYELQVPRDRRSSMEFSSSEGSTASHSVPSSATSSTLHLPIEATNPNALPPPHAHPQRHTHHAPHHHPHHQQQAQSQGAHMTYNVSTTTIGGSYQPQPEERSDYDYREGSAPDLEYHRPSRDDSQAREHPPVDDRGRRLSREGAVDAAVGPAGPAATATTAAAPVRVMQAPIAGGDGGVFSSSFGLMSLEDPSVLAGYPSAAGGVPFFAAAVPGQSGVDDPDVTPMPAPPPSTSATVAATTTPPSPVIPGAGCSGHRHTISTSTPYAAGMWAGVASSSPIPTAAQPATSVAHTMLTTDKSITPPILIGTTTPEGEREREGEREVKEMWKQYLVTPPSGHTPAPMSHAMQAPLQQQSSTTATATASGRQGQPSHVVQLPVPPTVPSQGSSSQPHVAFTMYPNVGANHHGMYRRPRLASYPTGRAPSGDVERYMRSATAGPGTMGRATLTPPLYAASMTGSLPSVHANQSSVRTPMVGAYGRDQAQDQRQDLHSYEAAVKARPSPPSLNLGPKARARARQVGAAASGPSAYSPRTGRRSASRGSGHASSPPSLTTFSHALGGSSPTAEASSSSGSQGYASRESSLSFEDMGRDMRRPGTSSSDSASVASSEVGDGYSMRPGTKRMSSEVLESSKTKRCALDMGVDVGDAWMMVESDDKSHADYHLLGSPVENARMGGGRSSAPLVTSVPSSTSPTPTATATAEMSSLSSLTSSSALTSTPTSMIPSS
ncbi:hypothetical protein AX16_005460 [Volvariella volvacea WC 439]|nr:hypothetical protein AX16_005460 [Volvariella volvacea WC 439]